MTNLDELKQKPANKLSLVECAILAAEKAGNINLAYRAADELAAQTAAIEAAREVLSMYANKDNWASHDGYMYLKTLSHPWGDAVAAFAALPAVEAK